MVLSECSGEEANASIKSPGRKGVHTMSTTHRPGLLMDLESIRATCSTYVLGPCCETSSGHMLWAGSDFMLWDMFRTHVVKRVVDSCFGLCAGPMLWNVFEAHVLEHVLGL